MRGLALLVLPLGLAACSSPPKPELRNTAPHTAGVAPVVTRGGLYGLTAEHVPAISADGTQIVAAVRESDGARGFPNLTLVVKNRRDETIAQHVVLSLAESDQMLADAEGNNPALDARIARANAWLAERHFAAMLALDPEKTQVPADRTQAAGDGFTISWAPSQLKILERGNLVVDRQTPPSWLPESVKVGTNVCQRTAYLGGAAIAPDRDLAVVTISYVADSDFCLEPPDQHHVVTW